MRNADLGLQKIRQNSAFIKDASHVKFEAFDNFDGIPNAVADIEFKKIEGQIERTYIAEFKAGDQVITTNFHTQCINYFQRVTDINHLKIFRRTDVALSKQSVVNNWVNNGVISDVKVQELFTNHYNKLNPVNILQTRMTDIQLKNYLENNNAWFDEIFNSNFN